MRIVWKSPKKHGMMKLSQCRTAERYPYFYETEVRLWRGVRFGKTFLRKRFWPSLLPDFLLREFQLGVIFLDGLRRFLLCHGWSLLSAHRHRKRTVDFLGCPCKIGKTYLLCKKVLFGYFFIRSMACLGVGHISLSFRQSLCCDSVHITSIFPQTQRQCYRRTDKPQPLQYHHLLGNFLLVLPKN